MKRQRTRPGFGAPMIGGGMGVHYLAAAIWARREPQLLDLSIYFRRPIFWDEQFTTAVQGSGNRSRELDGIVFVAR